MSAPRFILGGYEVVRVRRRTHVVRLEEDALPAKDRGVTSEAVRWYIAVTNRHVAIIVDLRVKPPGGGGVGALVSFLCGDVARPLSAATFS